MKTKLLLLVSFITLMNLTVFAGHDIPAFFGGSSQKYTSVSASVRECSGQKEIYAYQNDRLLTPASVLKLYTTASALAILSPDYTFRTTLACKGSIQAGGILEGDLIVIGGGDPTLGSRYFKTDPIASFINGLQKKGICQIKGNICIDSHLYGAEIVPNKWIWEDMGNYYGSGVWGLNYKDNTYELYLRSKSAGSKPEILKTNPVIPSIKFVNQLRSKANNKDSAYIYGAPFQNERVILGSIPANKESFVIKGDMPEPARVFASDLASALKQAGIKWDGNLVFEYESALKYDAVLCSHSSPKLSDICRITNIYSNNLFAEGLLRAISLKKNNRPSYLDGVEAENNYWKKQGVDVKGIDLFDGSGLSPVNKIHTGFITHFLSKIYSDSSFGNTFAGTLPLVGKEGTVKNMLNKKTYNAEIRLKSGSMGGVLAYAGYIKKGGRCYSVSIIVNNYNGTFIQTRNAIEKWLDALITSL
ncbi:MAG: D-alanyl-D-alanine carboxypeptidase/D-alanyl-D-alanine endopeptidase [Bacteroidales bacterium]